MKRIAVFYALTMTLVGISGCASNSYDSLSKQHIALMNEQADAIDKNAPESTINSIVARQEEVVEKMKSVKVSDEEKKKVDAQDMKASRQALKRVLEAYRKKQMGTE
jgi:aspartate carbamoyltransferase regulatory subunit